MGEEAAGIEPGEGSIGSNGRSTLRLVLESATGAPGASCEDTGLDEMERCGITAE